MNTPAPETPAPWFTEEMVETMLDVLYDFGHDLVYPSTVRATLEAITPMVTKWVGDLQASEGELMREDGYRAGYNQAVKDLN